MNQDARNHSITRQRIALSCRRFQRAIHEGQSPKIEDFITESPVSERRELLKALVVLDLQLTTKGTTPPDIDAYLRRFPQEQPVLHAALREAGFDELLRSHAAGSVDTISQVQAIGETAAFENTTVSSDTPPVPCAEQIDRFIVLDILGEGAFGRVYRAHDPMLNREVALKVPNSGTLCSEQGVKRFLREGRAAANLRHPNICPVFELGNDGDTYYIAMAYIEGQTLAARNKSTEYSAADAMELVHQLAIALNYAHQKGIVHRDLKPGNIMFDDEHGEPVIMDFGLAYFAEPSDSLLTQAGVVMGTPSHMSPEQARGAIDEVNTLSDVYSLGVILYELLTGRLPFTGSVAEVLGNILHVDPQAPSTIRSSIDAQLEAICLKAMAKRPADRYQSMQQLASAVEEWQRERAALQLSETTNAEKTPPESSLQTVGTGTPTFFTNRRLLMGSLLLVAVACVIVGGLWHWFWGKGDLPPAIASAKSQQAAEDRREMDDTSTSAARADMATQSVEVTRFEVLASRNNGAFHPVDEIRTLQSGDSVRFSITLSGSAYVRLVWVDAEGAAQELYPLDPELGDRGSMKVNAVESPLQVDRGWPLEPIGDSEMAILLVSQKPFADSPFPALIWERQGDDFTQVTHYSASRTSRPEVQGADNWHRGLSSATRQVDDPVLRLLEQLRQQTDTVHAVRIPTVAESESEPSPAD